MAVKGLIHNRSAISSSGILNCNNCSWKLNRDNLCKSKI